MWWIDKNLPRFTLVGSPGQQTNKQTNKRKTVDTVYRIKKAEGGRDRRRLGEGDVSGRGN